MKNVKKVCFVLCLVGCATQQQPQSNDPVTQQEQKGQEQQKEQEEQAPLTKLILAFLLRI